MAFVEGVYNKAKIIDKGVPLCEQVGDIKHDPGLTRKVLQAGKRYPLAERQVGAKIIKNVLAIRENDTGSLQTVVYDTKNGDKKGDLGIPIKQIMWHGAQMPDDLESFATTLEIDEDKARILKVYYHDPDIIIVNPVFN